MHQLGQVYPFNFIQLRCKIRGVETPESLARETENRGAYRAKIIEKLIHS
jgi:hypothetical protein